jgi:hypothetical protein
MNVTSIVRLNLFVSSFFLIIYVLWFDFSSSSMQSMNHHDKLVDSKYVYEFCLIHITVSFFYASFREDVYSGQGRREEAKAGGGYFENGRKCKIF